MLENSYDASGIKFGIMLSPELHSKSKMIKSLFAANNAKKVYKLMGEIISKPPISIIDFSDVDGLTVDEVSKMSTENQANGYIVFVIYSNMKSGGRVIYNGIDTYTFISVNEDLRNMPIDKAVASYYINCYSELDEGIKKKVNCFLQRYLYGTKERTDQVLDEKVYKKQQNK